MGQAEDDDTDRDVDEVKGGQAEHQGVEVSLNFDSFPEDYNGLK